MPAQILTIEALSRQRLNEITPRYWSSAELTEIIIAGIKDLWRTITDLKQEHFLTINNTDVTYEISATQLSGVPADVHKVYMIEPRTITSSSSNSGLQFLPRDYNHDIFRSARTLDPIDPSNDVIYYSIAAPGGPVGAPVIYCAPRVASRVLVSFAYVPTLPDLNTNSIVPIPAESTNALVAYTVAFARAKESDTRAPDPGWLTIYATEKNSIMESLGIRQYQEDTIVDAMFESYWG